VLSTLYATGLHAGPHEERAYEDGAGFANHYEHSKWRAEQVALASDLPVRVLRLATVIADDDGGAVTQYNAFHNTLKLFYYGLLSLLPGDPDTPLYFVTGDFAARAVAAVLDDEDARAVYHVSHAREDSLSLARLVESSFAEFGRSPDFARRRLLPPLWTDRESFELLVGGLRSFGGQVVNQALNSVAPFARQLFVTKDVRNDRLREVLPSYRPPDTEALITRTCARLVATRWGRAEAA
jgi:nucleoside-diphosphate-sugar epimerase